jgi:hypothetical protein
MKTLTRLAACLTTLYLTIGFMDTFAQATGDNLPAPGKYLGFNGAQNLEFRTNNLTRMQHMQTGNSTINGFTVARGGFLGLSQDPTFFTAGAASPFSLLHLNGDNASGLPQELGFRDWMRYGLTSTHNQDLMYVGQRSNGTDITACFSGSI